MFSFVKKKNKLPKHQRNDHQMAMTNQMAMINQITTVTQNRKMNRVHHPWYIFLPNSGPVGCGCIPSAWSWSKCLLLMINTLYLNVKILDLQRRSCFINIGFTAPNSSQYDQIVYGRCTSSVKVHECFLDLFGESFCWFNLVYLLIWLIWSHSVGPRY